MNEKLLQETTIAEYIDLLKNGSEKKKIKEINDSLNSKVSNFSGGFDLELFQMQKDLILLQVRAFSAFLERDKEKQNVFEIRVQELQKKIEQKFAKKGKQTDNPYQSFLSWILTVEKYLSFAIDRNNDLLYLISATDQMMKFYEAQKQNYEQQKAKKK